MKIPKKSCVCLFVCLFLLFERSDTFGNGRLKLELFPLISDNDLWLLLGQRLSQRMKLLVLILGLHFGSLADARLPEGVETLLYINWNQFTFLLHYFHVACMTRKGFIKDNGSCNYF